jgi:hypothetical protein
MAETRRALALRWERNRGRNCRSAGMGERSLLRARIGFKSTMGGKSVAPNTYVPRRAAGECDIQHKIAFLSDLALDIGDRATRTHSTTRMPRVSG